jgi:hypothetical protein
VTSTISGVGRYSRRRLGWITAPALHDGRSGQRSWVIAQVQRQREKSTDHTAVVVKADTGTASAPESVNNARGKPTLAGPTHIARVGPV